MNQNRPIKFRVWDKLLNKYIPFNSFISFDNSEYIIQQFTGVKDKNGIELFEGDIVKSDLEHLTYILAHPEVVYTRGEIEWLWEGFAVTQAGIGAMKLSEFVTCNCCGCGLEIIGNVLELERNK